MKDISFIVKTPARRSQSRPELNDNLRTVWHGVESLLQRVERLTAGTPFRTPIAIVDVLIELGNVCLSPTLHATFADSCPRPLLTVRTHWRNWTGTAERLAVVNMAYSPQIFY